MVALDLALAGVALGSVVALSGIGLLLTYRMTGVFNLAHGGIAMLCAYLLWQLVVGWGVPLVPAAALVLLVVAPGIGVAAERWVFRPLAHRGASPAESLVATLGLLVLLLGVAVVGWGVASRTDAPALFPTGSVALGGGVRVGTDALVQLGIVTAATTAIAWVTGRTHLGAQIRATVDRRDLAELSAVDADRVAAIGWAAGAFFAGLTGVLLAPELSLNPYNLTLVVLETFAIPVIARLHSLPVAIVSGLVIGVAQSELVQLHPDVAWLAGLVRGLQVNGLVVALLVFLLVYDRLREVGGGDAGLAATFATRRADDVSGRRRALEYAGAGMALAVPLLLDPTSLRLAQDVPALAVVFVSLVAVTGYGGQISLGQAGFAGLGALFYAKLAQGDLFGLPPLSPLAALAAGMVVAGTVGFATGYPAIRRRGLFLALTTFAVGAVVSRFVFAEPYFTAGVRLVRPQLGGVSLVGDRAFYAAELVALAGVLLAVRNLRSGRLGRALVAMRDNEDGARALGVDVSVLKMFVFAASSALAGLGGAMLAMSRGAFDATAYDPLQGMFWFTAVVVFGADSAAGAVLAAAFVVAVDTALVPNASSVLVGMLALFIGRLPGGAVEGLRRAGAAALTPRPLLRRFAAAAPGPVQARLSAAGRARLARARR